MCPAMADMCPAIANMCPAMADMFVVAAGGLFAIACMWWLGGPGAVGPHLLGGRPPALAMRGMTWAGQCAGSR
jgi:hypothetical protein